MSGISNVRGGTPSATADAAAAAVPSSSMSLLEGWGEVGGGGGGGGAAGSATEADRLKQLQEKVRAQLFTTR